MVVMFPPLQRPYPMTVLGPAARGKRLFRPVDLRWPIRDDDGTLLRGGPGITAASWREAAATRRTFGAEAHLGQDAPWAGGPAGGAAAGGSLPPPRHPAILAGAVPAVRRPGHRNRRRPAPTARREPA